MRTSPEEVAAAFRALLLASVPLSAALGVGKETRVALNGLTAEIEPPYIVFGVTVEHENSLSGAAEDCATTAAIAADVWGLSSKKAGEIADVVEGALLSAEQADPALSCWVASRAPDFDPQTGLDVVTLNITWLA
jgi:hypothetical protein